MKGIVLFQIFDYLSIDRNLSTQARKLEPLQLVSTKEE